jgi:glutaredoxin
MTEVVLYGKPGCHLCADALAVVRAVRAERPFDLVEVDVSADPELHARYGVRIPVVAVAGRELFDHHVDPDALRRALDEAAAGPA